MSVRIARTGSTVVDDVRLIDIVGVLRERGRAILLVATVIFALLSVVVVLDKEVYRAYVTLVPSRPLIDPNRMSLAETLLDLGNDVNPDVFERQVGGREAFAILGSRMISRRFIESENLMPVLYPERWDRKRKMWIESDEGPPTINDAIAKLENEIRFISRSETTGFIRVNIEWSDPAFAARWANRLVEMTDDAIRKRDIEEARQSIRFLEEQAKTVPIDSVRELIYSLIESYSNAIMVASVKDNYAFTVIDPAIAPQQDDPVNMPLSFRLSLVLIFSLGCGALYAIVAAQLASRGRRRRHG